MASFLLRNATTTTWAPTLARSADWDRLFVPGELYRACVQDVGKDHVQQHLQAVCKRARARLALRPVYGMELATQEVLHAGGSPRVTVVTGGPSVGKSLLLSRVSREPHLQALYLQGYELSKSSTCMLVQHVEAAERAHKWPVVIVDQAHRFFGHWSEHANAWMQLLLVLSKEERRLGVLLGSHQTTLAREMASALHTNDKHFATLHIGTCAPFFFFIFFGGLKKRKHDFFLVYFFVVFLHPFRRSGACINDGCID